MLGLAYNYGVADIVTDSQIIVMARLLVKTIHYFRAGSRYLHRYHCLSDYQFIDF